MPWSKSKVGNKKCVIEELFLNTETVKLKPMSAISLLESIFNDHEPIGITRNEPNTNVCANAHSYGHKSHY